MMKNCNVCDKAYKPHNGTKSKYCSADCMKYARAVKTTTQKCLCCEKEFTDLAKYSRVYCSVSCSNKSRTRVVKIKEPKRYIQTVENWLNGIDSGSDINGVLLDRFRNYLIAEAGSKCTQCGWDKPNPKLGYPILTIDHIDGNWKNNQRINLVVICFNCHTLTPTFGSLNKGNGAGKRGTYNRVNAEFVQG